MKRIGIALSVVLLIALAAGWAAASSISQTSASGTVYLPAMSNPAAPSSGSDCPSAAFMDVSTYQQTQNYPAPTLSVACSDTVMTVNSNGIPNFEFVQITPSDLQAQSYAWQIPLNPQQAASTSSIPLLGPVAIAINGLPFYGPNEAQPTYGDPLVNNLLDFCNGHTAQRGDYHFHARPDCLVDNQASLVNQVVGYSFDGFPIVTPYVCVDAGCTSTRKVSSSWQKINDSAAAWDSHAYVAGSGDLDECNGMVGADGQYRYYATDTFPYILGCYRGTAISNGPGGGGPGPGQPADGSSGQPSNGGAPTGPGNGTPPSNGTPPNNGQPGPGGRGPGRGPRP